MQDTTASQIILSTGQIVGLLLFLEPAFKKRSRHYKGSVFLFAGLCPIIKTVAFHCTDVLSMAAAWAGIVLFIVGVRYFISERPSNDETDQIRGSQENDPA